MGHDKSPKDTRLPRVGSSFVQEGLLPKLANEPNLKPPSEESVEKKSMTFTSFVPTPAVKDQQVETMAKTIGEDSAESKSLSSSLDSAMVRNFIASHSISKPETAMMENMTPEQRRAFNKRTRQKMRVQEKEEKIFSHLSKKLGLLKDDSQGLLDSEDPNLVV
mmetsp:Transcript_136/g.128  ORF Transcript_136/g.128 Transcript_136/m.128 type:complete len:163 (-) Transcript_136:302-790(-)